MRICWISTWKKKCGIATYSKGILPAVKQKIESTGGALQLFTLDPPISIDELVHQISAFEPTIIHVQHEYGLWGGKNPPRYSFPSFVKKIKNKLIDVKIVATAHTVLPPDYRFPIQFESFKKTLFDVPLRLVANAVLLPRLRNEWGKNTWGTLDGVIVHSALQEPWIKMASQKTVSIIPHYVPTLSNKNLNPKKLQLIQKEDFLILVFGFLSKDKGQDIALEALHDLVQSGMSAVKLVLAGGVRRKNDEDYFKTLQKKINHLGLSQRVIITGFVAGEEVGAWYERADLVVAPFRSTTGSGSLVQGIARGAAILASDLELNREVEKRVSHCIGLFHTEDSKDLAQKIIELMKHPELRDNLKQNARKYALEISADKMAEDHIKFYNNIR